MPRLNTLAAFAGGVAVTLSLAALIGAGPDDKPDATPDAAPAAMPDMPDMPAMPSMEEMMEMMAEYATPDAHHEMFKKQAGEWACTLEFAMPDGPVMSGTGTMTVKTIMDGRYMVSTMEVPDFMGSPFSGMALTGYSRVKEVYQSVWIDTWGTNMTATKGKMDEHGKLLMQGTASTPMGDNGMRIVTEWTDADTWVDHFFDEMPDGSWHNSGKITYTRR